MPVIGTGTGWIRHVLLNVAGRQKLRTSGISFYIFWATQVLHHDLDLDLLVCRSFVKAHDRTHSREGCTITSKYADWME
jgi:hypothetical protein